MAALKAAIYLYKDCFGYERNPEIPRSQNPTTGTAMQPGDVRQRMCARGRNLFLRVSKPAILYDPERVECFFIGWASVGADMQLGDVRRRICAWAKGRMFIAPALHGVRATTPKGSHVFFASPGSQQHRHSISTIQYYHPLII